jgi:tetratricopeptide (TPR) repeat protein
VDYFASNDLKNAQECAEEALRLSQEISERHWEGPSRIWFGRILEKAETVDSRKGEEHILQGIKICDELSLKPWSAKGYLFLGELCADTGRSENAFENLRKAEEMFQEMEMDYWLTKTREVLGRL